MSQINIEVIGVQVENKGKFSMAQVAYKGPDGKVEGKKLPSFNNPEVFKTLTAAQQGDLFQVVSEKDNNGYWQWTSAVAGGKNVGNSETGVVAVKSQTTQARSNFETPEERAARQVYIVRQSSISNAVDLLKDPKKVASVDEVLAVAKEFEEFVFGTRNILQEPEIV